MSAYEFNAKSRSELGSQASRRLRKAEDLPGVVYGQSETPVPITLSHHQMYQLMKQEEFHSSIVNMNLDGKSQKVLLRDFQLHPYKSKLLHIDFQFVSEKHEVNMTVPLHFVGAENSPGVKIGHGIPSHIMVELDIACLPKDLPSFIEVDMSTLEVGDSVHARGLKLPSGVKLVLATGDDPVVAAMHSPVKEEVDSVVTPEAAETPASKDESK